MDLSDDAEAYAELEKYVSANSPSSVKSLMRRVILEGLPAAGVRQGRAETQA